MEQAKELGNTGAFYFGIGSTVLVRTKKLSLSASCLGKELTPLGELFQHAAHLDCVLSHAYFEFTASQYVIAST